LKSLSSELEGKLSTSPSTFTWKDFPSADWV